MVALTNTLVINRVRDILGDTPWMQGGTGSNFVTGTATTIAVTDGTRWSEGNVMEFQANGEQAWVQSVSANNVTVIRSIRGTPAAATQATGILFKDPVYGYSSILNAVNLTIQGLWPYVYKKVSFPTGLTYSASTYWYDLADAAWGLISVTQIQGSSPAYLLPFGHKGSHYPVVFRKNLPSGLVASGTGMAFPRGWPSTTTVVNVDYAAKLTATQTTPPTYDDWTDTTLDLDMLAYGAAARLVKNYEVNRVSDEDTGMGDQSVQAGMRFNIGLRLEAEFVKLRNIRHEELRRIMPIMKSLPGSGGVSDTYAQRGSSIPYP